MSGHSKWSTIKRAKGAADAKRGAVFTKIGNQIAVAARSGSDPSMNPSLAMVIEKARAANMPMTNIERAIARVSDKNAAAVDEVMYEGYGPGGVAILVEAATDNKNRTYPDVRHAFSKHGGNIAEPGSVAFQFVRRGSIRVDLGTLSPDEGLLAALDGGAEDAEIDTEDGASTTMLVYTDAKLLHTVRGALTVAGLSVREAELTYTPNVLVHIDNAETARKVVRLLEALDELDDVVATHSNFDIDDSIEL